MVENQKRRAQRVAYDGRFTGSGERFSFADQCNDISRAGVGVNTVRNLQADELVQLEIDLPNAKTLSVKGRVVWSGGVNNLDRRSGIEFLQLDPEAKRLIDTIVEGKEEA